MPHFQQNLMMIFLRQDFFNMEKNVDVFNEFFILHKQKKCLAGLLGYGNFIE